MANKKTYLRAGVIVTTVILILVLINGFLDGYQNSVEKSDQITEVLKENCECVEINRIIYAKGLQFGKDGISTEKAEYELIDCNYKSIEKEAIRINEILNKKVKDFKDFDLLTIELNNNQNRETITIKNGIIQ